MTIWEILEIEFTKDERVIKKAYAKQSKLHHPETDPEGFQLVYNAYQKAIKIAKASKNEAEESYFAHDIELDLEELGKSKKQGELIEFNIGDVNEKEIRHEETLREKQNNQEQQSESLFGKLINYVDLEKRKYYNSPAIAEFIRIFSNQDIRHTWAPWRKYVESSAFLRAQFDRKFIRYLVEYLKEQQDIKLSKLPQNLFCELCTAYGIMTDDEVYRQHDIQPLIDIMDQNERKVSYINMMTCEKNVVERRYAFYIYRSVLQEFEKEASCQTMTNWISILEDATFSISQKVEKHIKVNYYNPDVVYLKVERSPLVFELLTYFLEMHEYITHELYFALYQLFEIQEIQGGDELEIMLLTLKKKSSPAKYNEVQSTGLKHPFIQRFKIPIIIFLLLIGLIRFFEILVVVFDLFP